MQLRRIVPIKIKEKKGDIFQIIFVLIILLIIAIMALLTGKLSLEITKAYQLPGLHLNDSSAGVQANQLIQDMTPPLLDFFVFFFFLGSNVGLIVSAIRTKYSPTIIFLFIMLLIIEILIASGFVNIYQGFHDEPSLQPIPQQMPLTNILFSKYTPLIFTVIGAIVLIFMYGKSGGDISI